jgi:hypothetical protein
MTHITIQRSTMEAVLEALWTTANPKAEEAITTIKAALAQPAQREPVEQSCFCHSGVSLQSVSGGASPDGYLGRLTLLIDGLRVEYVAAQPAPVQEPVGVFVEDDDIGHVRLIPHQQMKLKAWDKLYTTPQQRKPLSVEDVRKAGGIVHKDGNIFFTNIGQMNAALGITAIKAALAQPAPAQTDSFQFDIDEDVQLLMDRDMGDN